MNVRTIAAALGIAILTTSIPVLASAATETAGPVIIKDVNIQPSYGVFNNFSYRGLVNVVFTNTNPVPATDIVFDLESASGTILDQFEDVGSFAKGIAIHHHFNDDAMDYNQKLVVDSIAFADGTEWTTYDTMPVRARRQATVGRLNTNDFPFLHG
jgi:hypothetical protein